MLLRTGTHAPQSVVWMLALCPARRFANAGSTHAAHALITRHFDRFRKSRASRGH